jgi:hypothetical protein
VEKIRIEAEFKIPMINKVLLFLEEKELRMDSKEEIKETIGIKEAIGIKEVIEAALIIEIVPKMKEIALPNSIIEEIKEAIK